MKIKFPEKRSNVLSFGDLALGCVFMFLSEEQRAVPEVYMKTRIYEAAGGGKISAVNINDGAYICVYAEMKVIMINGTFVAEEAE